MLGRLRGRPDEGSASLLVVGLSGLLVFLLTAVLLLAAVLGMKQRADTAADLAALGAGRARVTGADPCFVAKTVAAENGARTVGCQVTAGEVEVVVEVFGTGVLGVLPPASARARAG